MSFYGWLKTAIGNPYGTPSDPLFVSLTDGDGNPLASLDGALDVHDADVHSNPINELFHKHTATVTTLTADLPAQGQSITVASGVGFANGDDIQISNGVIETTFPRIVSGGGTTTLVLDRPIDNAFSIGDTVEKIDIEMKVDGSGTPVAFVIMPDLDLIGHMISLKMTMTHTTVADDSHFGDLTALTRGLVFRFFNGATGQYRTFANWKSNSDFKTDFGSIAYTDKAGGGLFGTDGSVNIKFTSGAVPKLNGANNDHIEILVQDDLRGLSSLRFKAQGHWEGV